MFLTKLSLRNFCNYSDHTFSFKKEDGTPYRYVCFFGPNGIGKSTLLEAISLLTMNHLERDIEYIKRSLKKYVRNKDYIPGFDRMGSQVQEQMVIEGTYESEGRSYVVRMTENGFEQNDLENAWGANSHTRRIRLSHMITSDNDLTLSKFQVRTPQIKTLEEITSKVMRFPTKCVDASGFATMDSDYCTDFVIYKKEHNIHYKRMSAGEKKIVKSFSQLLNLVYDLEHPFPGEIVMAGWPKILLFDNIELHIYYDRHKTMVECVKGYFPQQQIFSTTHSGILIQDFLNGNRKEDELMINLEEINH